MANCFMYIDRFIDYLLLERNYSKNTVESYRIDLQMFADFIQSVESGLDLLSVDKDIVRMWVVSMMESGSKTTTVNRRLSSVRSFYRFMQARGYRQDSPVSDIAGPKVGRPLPKFVRDSEMEQILSKESFSADYSGVRDRLIISLFYETGVRLAELVAIDDKDIDFDNRTIKVTGKRNKQRIIPFGEALSEQIKSYLLVRDAEFATLSGALLLNKKGGRIDRHQIYRLVKGVLATTSAEKRSPHVLRHTFATSMLNNGAQMGAVKELMGHSSLATTEMYIHITFQQLKEIYKQAHPRA